MTNKEASSRMEKYLSYLESLGCDATIDEILDTEAFRLAINALRRSDSYTYRPIYNSNEPRMAFCTFVERISPTSVKLSFRNMEGTFEGVVDKSNTYHITMEPFTSTDWESIDFETLKEQKCICSRYKNSNYVMIFGITK